MRICFANPKGGSGKTTMAMVTALTMSDADRHVCVVDLDPSGNFKDWVDERQERGGEPPFTFIAHEGTQAQMLGIVDDLSTGARADEFDFVLFDTEGSARKITNHVILNSDLVIIPIKDDPQEARQALKLVEGIEELAEKGQTDIDYVLAFTDIGDVAVSRDKKIIEEQLQEFEIPLLGAELRKRQAFRAIKQDGMTLRELAAGIEVVKGIQLPADRQMDKKEQAKRGRQMKSANSAIEAANNFTHALISHIVRRQEA